MSLSIKSVFFLASGCPYQYASGNNAFEDKDVGAEVAAVPRIFAGDAVGSGLLTGATDSAPGADQAPSLGSRFTRSGVHP